MFGRRRLSSAPYSAPAGVNATPQGLVRSVPFSYEAGTAALDLSKSESTTTLGLDLGKSYNAAKDALDAVGLLGLRGEVIAMVDDSGSIQGDWDELLKIIVRYLGVALTLSPSGKVTVILYGRPDQPVTVTKDNYQQLARMLRPTWGLTPMGETLRVVMDLMRQFNCLTFVGNVTDGNPYDGGRTNAEATMTNAVIEFSGHPGLLKNMAIREVPYLETIDDLPSQIEYEKDSGGRPVRDSNDNLVLYRNPHGVRLIDNVDSKAVPHVARMTDQAFAEMFADEVNPTIEVMGHAGHLIGVPGHPRTF